MDKKNRSKSTLTFTTSDMTAVFFGSWFFMDTFG